MLVPQVYVKAGKEFPSDPKKQLELAIKAVFDSWDSPRARAYREINGITGASLSPSLILPLVLSLVLCGLAHRLSTFTRGLSRWPCRPRSRARSECTCEVSRSDVLGVAERCYVALRRAAGHCGDGAVHGLRQPRQDLWHRSVLVTPPS
jgi:hypothetical protein